MRVSVVIPSYNRAKLLLEKIPTYLQEDVIEVIIVDDASVDNTAEVVKKIQEKYPQVKYIRNAVNKKQTYSKNIGIKISKGDYIYLGDDDSILMPNSIRYLKETMYKYNADICGAKALYLPMEYVNKIDEYVQLNDIQLVDKNEIVDIKKIKASFNYSTALPIVVPFCQACALVKKELAIQILFDENFTGNAYREETDFFIRCTLQGAKVMYDSRAVQVNLPRQVATGGAHSRGRIKWYLSTIANNWYFLKKNWKNIQSYYKFSDNIYKRQLMFVLKNICFASKAVVKILMRNLGLLLLYVY